MVLLNCMVNWLCLNYNSILDSIRIIVGLSCIVLTPANALCRFPSFLDPSSSSAPRSSALDDVTLPSRSAFVWHTESRFESNTFRVGSELEVTLRDGDTLVTKVKHSGQCADARPTSESISDNNASCHQREFLYQRTCLSPAEDDANKYVVEHNDGM